jgi:hypothetical protein
MGLSEMAKKPVESKETAKPNAKRIRAGIVTVEEITEIADSITDSLQRLADLQAILKRRGIRQLFINGILTGKQAKQNLVAFNTNIERAIAHDRTE